MRKLEHPKVESRENAKQKESAMNAKPRSILEAFEYIVELAEDSNLDENFFAKAAAHIRYVSRKLKLTATQVVLLAMFVDRSEDSRIMIFRNCKISRMPYHKDSATL